MFIRNNKKQKSVKIISAKSGPSWATLGLVELVNRLNASGLKTDLYGESRWPIKYCSHYKTLDQLSIESGDIFVNDGFRVNSMFDLINLDRYRYSHGRKKRLAQWARFIKRYFFIGIRARKVKVVPFCIKGSDASPSILIDRSCQVPIKKNGVTFVRSDIDFSLTSLEEIQNHDGVVILAAAIRHPSAFREHIAPRLNEKIRYIGFAEPPSNFRADNAEAEKYVTLWRNYLLGLN